MQNHRFSGAILHSVFIFNRKIEKVGIMLQVAQAAIPIAIVGEMWTDDVKKDT